MSQYLGDSLHVEVERGMLRLFTRNPWETDHEVYLEPFVWARLADYVDRCGVGLEDGGIVQFRAPADGGASTGSSCEDGRGKTPA